MLHTWVDPGSCERGYSAAHHDLHPFARLSPFPSMAVCINSRDACSACMVGDASHTENMSAGPGRCHFVGLGAKYCMHVGMLGDASCIISDHRSDTGTHQTTRVISRTIQEPPKLNSGKVLRPYSLKLWHGIQAGAQAQLPCRL